MSLQEIEKSHIRSGQEGLAREIDQSSHNIMLDVLQVSQYTKPIDSTVRELASNAVDSQKEKKIAIEILTGESKPEKYFHTREGSQYKDSRWTPEYYSLNHLDMDNNNVVLSYEEGTGVGFTDKFIVTDFGVGLGMPRLKGYLSLGYSTKRNSASAFGAYGLGAKSSLSTGADYYTVETVHNGKKFKLNCFAYKIDSIIPKFNVENNRVNNFVNIGSEEKPYYAYYEETDSKNYTRIITPVKRHNRKRYKSAVKTQLLYFDNVIFNYKDEDGHETTVPFKARVLYNSNNLLISDTIQFHRPHIVVVKEKGSTFGVTYGTIDFQELEMQTLSGTIGFKCPIRSVDRDPETGDEKVLQEGVTVNPSRESVIWDNHTRNYIQTIISAAQTEASDLISEQLKEEDFYAWLQKANEIINRAQNRYSQNALGEISKIVDSTKITAKYQKDKTIKFYQNPDVFFWGINLRLIRTQNGKWERETGTYKKEIKRLPLESWGSFFPDRLYKMEGDDKSSPVKDRYLIEYHGGSFNQIKLQDRESLIKEAKEKHKDWEEDKVLAWVDKRIKTRDKIYGYLTTNENVEVKAYNGVEVPEDFEKKVSKEIEEGKKIETLSPAEKRALHGKVVCYTYEYKEGSYGNHEYKLNKEEPILGELDDIQHPVVYGTQADDPKFKMLANLFHYRHKQFQYKPNFFPVQKLKEEDYNGVAFARFSKRNTKHVKQNPNFIHVDKYLWNHDKKSYNVGTAFIPLFTSMFIYKRLRNLSYLTNFSIFNEDMSKAYNLLVQYKNDCYIDSSLGRVEHNSIFKEFKKKAQDLQEFQLLLEENKGNLDEVVRKQKSKELTGHEELESATVLDMSIVHLLQELETYSENIKDLFNHISFLEDADRQIPTEAQRLVTEILQNESLDSFKLSDKSITTLDKLSGKKQEVNNDN